MGRLPNRPMLPTIDLGMLEQPSKIWLRSEAHGSICVQEGEPNLRTAVGDPAAAVSPI
jgi:hypothetical protein